MDYTVFAMVGGGLLFFAVAFGAVLLSGEQKLRCIDAVKDKSASDIQAVCKF